MMVNSLSLSHSSPEFQHARLGDAGEDGVQELAETAEGVRESLTKTDTSLALGDLAVDDGLQELAGRGEDRVESVTEADSLTLGELGLTSEDGVQELAETAEGVREGLSEANTASA